ncbi:hypothetical protein ACI65C_004887 [Semiaphis heraclei]
MMLITKIFILITAITIISGKARDFSKDTVKSTVRDSISLRPPHYFQLCDKFQILIHPKRCRKHPPKVNTTNTTSIVNQHGKQRERRQALVKTRSADDGPGPVVSLTSSNYPLNVPRFQNGDVVNYSTINTEVIKWIRQQLTFMTKNRIQEFKLKNSNRLSSSKTPQR